MFVHFSYVSTFRDHSWSKLKHIYKIIKSQSQRDECYGRFLNTSLFTYKFLPLFEGPFVHYIIKY